MGDPVGSEQFPRYSSQRHRDTQAPSSRQGNDPRRRQYNYIYSIKTPSEMTKSLLSLLHGNADVERGFSENAALITDDRSSLSDISINGFRATKDAIKFYRQGKVPICKGLLDNVEEAHSRYQVDQEITQRILGEKGAIVAAAKLTKNKELVLVKK
ncbi:unnamed protein product [Rotaria magnacalcarata]|uniref:Uncharacterized protein n=1 Tax=Rotaria magnacalcarata TaxID=392030 RepID=A0A820CB74_9BILA|nr:unnamed protein product [Rotaria magnacalcarata]CAF3972891.1 unnamed protein product [Rotaria magnacalcarata]CAF4213074.1 unnamed protein product [Rotaria magnacalcarata]